MPDTGTQFPSIDALYDAFPEARHSTESDYGVWWKDDDGGNWRVTYIHATGHLYAAYLGGTASKHAKFMGQTMLVVSAGSDRGPVVILGKTHPFTDDRVGAADPMEEVLEGWAEVCGQQGSLSWVIDRINQSWDEHQVQRPHPHEERQRRLREKWGMEDDE